MTIACGTDFSQNARQIGMIAARLAKARGVPLLLIHVIDQLAAEHAFVVEGEDAFPAQAARLAKEAEHLHQVTGVRPETVLAGGPVGQVLVDQARRGGADLLVLGATGRRDPVAWLIGGSAARAVERSPIPVLIVRDVAALESWLNASSPLRTLVAVDRHRVDEHVPATLDTILPRDRLQVTTAHAADPAAEAVRIGLPGDADPNLQGEVARVLLRELAERVPSARDPVLIPRRGDAARSLVEHAEHGGFGLIVVGTRPREGDERAFSGAIARVVVYGATTNVLTVPLPAPQDDVARGIPVVRRVLAATDLSRGSGAAISYAYALLPHGGTVHLVHVLPTPEGVASRIWSELTDAPRKQVPTPEEVAERLRPLVPPEAARAGINTEVHVLAGDDPAVAIQTESERLGVDTICIGARGAGVADGGIGRIARRLLARCRRPVLAVRAPR